MTKFIVFANTKGGTGKTTSTICVATALAGANRSVEVWDADPQASATEWAEQARDNDQQLPFEVEVINRALVKRKKDRASVDYVLIDTPPGDPDMIDEAVAIADLVILPSAPAVMDLSRMLQTAAGVPKHIPRAGLLTRANKQTVAYREALEFLQEQDQLAVFSYSIGNRQAIQNSFGYRPDIFHEYSAVTDEILEVTE